MSPKGGPHSRAPKKPFEPDAFDFAILAALPDAGATIGKYLPDGVTVGHLRNIVDHEPTAYAYSTRLRLMHHYGFVQKVRAGANKTGATWQKTKAGEELLANRTNHR